MRAINKFFMTAIAVLTMSFGAFAQQTGSLSGQVQDTLGAVVVGATVTVVGPDGKQKTATSNQRGEFSVTNLAPGKYTVKTIAPNFGLYENTEVMVTAGKREELAVVLSAEEITEQVDINTNEGVSTDPENNVGGTVLKGQDLEALPDDPDELEAALQALAGPSAGPNGGQIYIDGFTGGRLPPKEAIREIRVNQNPFSAEFDRMGFGRIEILTRPGADRFRGSVNANFNDARLNSRNPFAVNRAPGQMRTFGGNISGPVQKGKSSFFVDVNQRTNDSNTVINANILDNNLNVIPFRQDVKIPTRRFSLSPRFDYQLNQNNTLIARYSFTQMKSENQGIGNLTLPSRAYDTESTGHELRLTETMIINPKTINETRFEFQTNNREQVGDNSIPTINVGSSFVGGGSQIGMSFNRSKQWELQNFTTTSFGASSQHAIKFGVRVRGISYRDRSENNFGGNFTFQNMDSYIDTIAGAAYPLQFNITTGNPEQKVNQTDFSLFFTDDWRINPALTLSFGLRYENQTNIDDNLNFAPRFSFAWAPGAGGARAPKTVIRGGFGIFYDRFSESYALQALRFNGVEQLNLIVNSMDPDPVRRAAAIALLQQAVFTVDGVTNAPTAAQIMAALPQSNTIRRVDPNIQSPYMYQATVGFERQLPQRTTLSVFYIASRSLHALRSRNINAPICVSLTDCTNAVRPEPTLGNILEYQSSGISNQNQVIFNVRSNFSSRISLWGNYRLGFAKSDTDGAGSQPAYVYDLTDEYGRSGGDSRHFVNIGGNVSLPWGISANPFITAYSGRPFNITRGFDFNGDATLNERPTYGELGARCAALNLSHSFCDVSGFDPNQVISRNFGQGSSFFSVNMRIGKSFAFGKSAGSASDSGTSTGGRQGGPGGGFPGGMGRGGMGGGGRGPGGFGGGDGRKPYNLNIGVFVTNLFNNVNYGNPVGNLSSDRFGQVISTQGGFGGFGGGGGGTSANRRVELSARFSW